MAYVCQRGNRFPRRWVALAILAFFGFLPDALALDPHKSLDQYSRRAWSSQQLRSTVRAITQTTDGYLWLASDEGLRRFDGYDFTAFGKSDGFLPSDSISALLAARDGSLWVGTRGGLTHYANKTFLTYTVKDGLPDNFINRIFEDHAGTLWITAGVYLVRYKEGRFKTFMPGKDIPLRAVHDVREDHNHQLWAGGNGGLARLNGEKFEPVITLPNAQGKTLTVIMPDKHNNLWMGSPSGLMEMSASGKIRLYDESRGLPATSVFDLLEDRDGNIWLATDRGLVRLDGNQFVTSHNDSNSENGPVRCIFEDHDGNLWVASPDGLSLIRDNAFTTYYQPDLPADELNAVLRDHSGRIWIGFHSSGLALLSQGTHRRYTVQDGLPSNEILSIRENATGDLLIGTRGGLARIRGEHPSGLSSHSPPAGQAVFDALEDSTGSLWLALSGGLTEVSAGVRRVRIPVDAATLNPVVTLYEGRQGTLWAGTDGKGLWRIEGDDERLFTTKDGLSSNWIRSLFEDSDGTMWIGTLGGGLDSLVNGRFFRFTVRDGLPSDNVIKVIDGGESLWLNTTVGIYQISKRQLHDFSEGKRKTLEPINYALDEGLSSTRCTPNDFPNLGGGVTGGHLWFITTCGVAVMSPNELKHGMLPPAMLIEEMTADGRPVDLTHPSRLKLNTGRVEIRYAGIHLGAPERLQYSYRLEGLDRDWVRAGSRRVADYNSLEPGRYRFIVRAQLSDGLAGERSYSFELLPPFYATVWFRFLCVGLISAIAWAMYRLHMMQVRDRFELVLEERARLARELHDTVVQNLFGISSQLEAVVQGTPPAPTPARRHLETALRMTHHSLTEARRSLMDLRASILEGQDLKAALHAGIRSWTAESTVDVNIDVDAASARVGLPQEARQNLVRIAQEAVNNALKHAEARQIRVRLYVDRRKLWLRISDNGCGLIPQEVLTSREDHFGLVGMQERARSLGGEFCLISKPGEGTEVEVAVPLP